MEQSKFGSGFTGSVTDVFIFFRNFVMKHWLVPTPVVPTRRRTVADFELLFKTLQVEAGQKKVNQFEFVELDFFSGLC